MTWGVTPVYDDAFAELLRQEAATAPEEFASVETFDEVPLYSRLRQVEFLADLPVADRNRQLINAAVAHLDRIVGHYRQPADASPAVLRMVSVTGWWVDDPRGGGECTGGDTALLRPNFWIGNLAHDRMRSFRLHPPASRCARFVEETVDTGRHEVFESVLSEDNLWCPRRVYVAVTGDRAARSVLAGGR